MSEYILSLKVTYFFCHIITFPYTVLVFLLKLVSYHNCECSYLCNCMLQRNMISNCLINFHKILNFISHTTHIYNKESELYKLGLYWTMSVTVYYKCRYCQSMSDRFFCKCIFMSHSALEFVLKKQLLYHVWVIFVCIEMSHSNLLILLIFLL